MLTMRKHLNFLQKKYEELLLFQQKTLVQLICTRKQNKVLTKDLTLLHSEWPKLFGVLTILSVIWLR